MELSTSQDFKSLIDSLIVLYKKLQHILLISLNDSFLSTNLDLLTNDPIIKDTIAILQDYNFNFKSLLDMNYSDDDSSFLKYKNNSFVELVKSMDDILSSNLIEKYSSTSSIPVVKKKGFKEKKDHETDKLSEFIKNIIDKEGTETLIEMGCGKSYLTNNLLINNEKILYIGIDMKDELIQKYSKKNIKENAVVIHSSISLGSFEELYNNRIRSLIKSKNQSEEKIFLFGLHSCGNLTSDTIKLYARYPCFSHIAIVGCCLNLLKEYISKEASETELFKKYINSIGYDSKGNYLEQTLMYDYNEELIGYPLSQYLRNSHPSLFLSRTVRNSSMQSISEHYQIDSVFYTKIFYRTLLQAFLEMYLPELKMLYGFGKIEINEQSSFKDYLTQVFNYLEFKSKSVNSDIIDKLHGLSNTNLDETVKIFLEKIANSDLLLWAMYLIRLKFAKIVEYIIALDRVIYLQELEISNIRLIKIFDENFSIRNILIYSSK